MGAEHPWIDISKAVFQMPAKLISNHHLQVSERPSIFSIFSVKREIEFQVEKPKEIYPPCGKGQVRRVSPEE